MRRSNIDDKIAAMMAKAQTAKPLRPTRADHGGCSGKDRYPSEEAARAVALMNGTEHRLTSYQCEHCGEWHLTRRYKGP